MCNFLNPAISCMLAVITPCLHQCIITEHLVFYKHKCPHGKISWHVLKKIYSYINLFPDCRLEVVWWSHRTDLDVLFHPTYVSNMYSM